MKFKAKKLVESKEEGEFLFQKYHVSSTELESRIINNVWENQSDDYEAAYSNGLSGDYDGDLFCIDADAFLKFCYEEIESLSADDEDEVEDLEDYKSIVKVLENFKGYNLYVDNTEVSK